MIIERTKTGEAIRKWRKQKNLTQAQLAKRIGKSASSVTKYEAGESRIPFEVLQRIADVLDVTLSDLGGERFGEEADEIISLARGLFNSAGYDLLEPWEHGEESYRSLYKVQGRGQSFYLTLMAISSITNKTSQYFRFLLNELPDGNNGE